MNARALLLPIATVLLSASLQAQRLPPAPGDRVRVTAPRYVNPSIVGSLLAVTTDSLSVTADRRPLTLPLSLVTQLEVSRGSNRGRNAIRALAVGFLLGAAIGTAACSGKESYACPENPLVAGVALGVVIGLPSALIAAISAGDRWETIPVPGRP